MFDLDEINKRTLESEKLLEAIGKKMSELKTEFDELIEKCSSHDDDYFRKNPEVREELSERIRQRLSVYDLLKEVAETIRNKTHKDMQWVLEELQKNKYYDWLIV